MNVPEKNRLEWAVFAASLVVIAIVIGVLVRFEVTRPDTPPDLHVRATGSRASGSGYAISVEVENRGGRTAASAVIEVELTGPSGQPERGEFQLPLVPRGAVRTGDVMFSTDPAAGTVRARVLGYETPRD